MNKFAGPTDTGSDNRVDIERQTGKKTEQCKPSTSYLPRWVAHQSIASATRGTTARHHQLIMKSLRVSRIGRSDPATTRAPRSMSRPVAAIESTQGMAFLDSAEHLGTTARKEGEQRAQNIDREATGEPDDARGRDKSGRWAVGHSYFRRPAVSAARKR